MRWKRLALGILALTIGSAAGTQIFAYQSKYHPVLGRPVARLGAHRLYLPTAGWTWAGRWGWRQPRAFQGAASVMLLTTALLALPIAKKKARGHVTARWATRQEVQAAGLFAAQGIVLGTFHGRVLRHNGPEHVLCVAPTQSGKTTSLVIPTLLCWEASVLVHDPKEELYALTAGWRQTFSRVINFQPTSPTSSRYNPLRAVRLETDHDIRDAQLIADMLVDPDGAAEHGGAAQHFRELAADLHTGLILHGLQTGHAPTLAALNALLTTQPFEALVTAMHASAHPAVQRAAGVTANLADRELSGVLSTASRALRLWTDPLIARATSGSDFTLEDLRERAVPLSLYLSIPFGDQARLRPLTRLIVRQVLDYCTAKKAGWRHRLLGLIDELPALRRLPILSEGLDYLAGYGITLCLITPSLNTLDHLYGARHNFIEACRFRVVFAPNDDEVAAKFSRMTGQAEVEKQREMVAREPFHTFRDRTTTSTETVQQPLLSPTALMQLPPESLLLLIGNSPPALLQKARYFHHPQWRARSTMPPPGGER